jgi:hypothetical protein
MIGSSGDLVFPQLVPAGHDRKTLAEGVDLRVTAVLRISDK